MWQLLWMFEFVPDMVWHVLLLVSAGTLFLAAFFPFVPYRFPLGILSTFILAISIWAEGGIANEAKWQTEIDKIKVALAEAEKKAIQKNIEIQEKIVYKDRVIYTKGQDIIKEIEKIVTVAGPERIIEVPGPERIKEITKDMTVEQRRAYEEQIEQLRQAQKQQQDRIVEVVKDLSPEQRRIYEEQIEQLARTQSKECAIPKILLDFHNEAVKNPTRQQGEKR